MARLSGDEEIHGNGFTTKDIVDLAIRLSGGLGGGGSGVGIASATIDGSGNLHIVLTDDTDLPVGHVVGAAGSAGLGIQSAAIVGGRLILTRTDSTTVDAGPLPSATPTPAGTNGQLQFNSNGTMGAVPVLSGDATLNVGTGAVTVSKVGGQTLGGAALLSVGQTTGTVAAGDDSRILAAQTASQVSTAISAAVNALVNSAPGTLDTLGEIATQLASDENAASALVATVAGKLAKASNLSDLTDTAAARTALGLTAIAQLATAARGSIVFFGASGPTVLGPGTAGYRLTTNGANADPTWTAVAGGGGSSVVPVTAIGNSGASQALAFPSDGTNIAYTATLTADCAFSVTGGAANADQMIRLYVFGGSSGFTPTFSGVTHWSGDGAAPNITIPAGGLGMFVFRTPNAGTTVIGEK